MRIVHWALPEHTPKLNTMLTVRLGYAESWMISVPDCPCVCGHGENCQVPPPLVPLHVPGGPPPPPGVSVGVAGRSVGVAVGPGGGVCELGILPAGMVETV